MLKTSTLGFSILIHCNIILLVYTVFAVHMFDLTQYTYEQYFSIKTYCICQWLNYVIFFTKRKWNMTRPGMSFDYFLSSVTDGLQPNAEESGTGCRSLAIGLYAQTHHAHIHTLPFSHQAWLATSLLPLLTTYIHQFNFVFSFMRNITCWHTD